MPESIPPVVDSGSPETSATAVLVDVYDLQQRILKLLDQVNSEATEEIRTLLADAGRRTNEAMEILSFASSTLNQCQVEEWSIDPYAVFEDVELLTRHIRTCLTTESIDEHRTLHWCKPVCEHLSQFQRTLLLANNRRREQGEQLIPLDGARLESVRQKIGAIVDVDQLLLVSSGVLGDLEFDLETLKQWAGVSVTPIHPADDGSPAPECAGEKTEVWGLHVHEPDKTASRFIKERGEWVTVYVGTGEKWNLLKAVIKGRGHLRSAAYANAFDVPETTHVTPAEYRAEVNRTFGNLLEPLKLKLYRRRLMETQALP